MVYCLGFLNGRNASEEDNEEIPLNHCSYLIDSSDSIEDILQSLILMDSALGMSPIQCFLCDNRGLL